MNMIGQFIQYSLSENAHCNIFVIYCEFWNDSPSLFYIKLGPVMTYRFNEKKNIRGVCFFFKNMNVFKVIDIRLCWKAVRVYSTAPSDNWWARYT